MKRPSAVAMLLAVLTLALLSGPVSALVDPASPLDGASLANGSLAFDYYASVPNLTGCSVNVPPYSFPDPDVQNSALNSVSVQSMPDGVYLWNVTCTGAQPETSATRAFTIDTVAPTLALIAPANGTTASSIAIDIIPADDRSSTLSCDVRWNADSLETIAIASNARTARTYTVASGPGTLRIACSDMAGNAAIAERSLTIQQPLRLSLSTDKASYGPQEPVVLTVDTLQGANVTVDVCPNQTGFVQCSTALIGSSSYPQTLTLPYMNKTGTYLIEGVARLGNQTRSNATSYILENTLVVSVAKNATPKPGVPLNLSASATGGIGPYRFSWTLSNGTTLANNRSVVMAYPAAAQYTERVTAYDSANNSRDLSVAVDVRATADITVRVYDNATGQPIVGASVSIDDEKAETFEEGIAIFHMPADTYDILASASGYRFSKARYHITESREIGLGLARDTDAPIVTLLVPAQGATIPSPLEFRATATHLFPLTCTLYLGGGDGWFSANGTAVPNADGTLAFLRDVPLGAHQARIECSDANGRTGASATIAFTVADGVVSDTPVDAPTDIPVTVAPLGSDAQRLQAELDEITAALEAIDKYGPDERQAIALTGFDRQIRNARRALQQAIRDMDALQYRTDLDGSARDAERARLMGAALDLLAKTPRSLRITDKQQWVRYADEQQVREAAQAILGEDAKSTTLDALTRQLIADQQKCTISTSLLSVEYAYPDGTTKPSTLMTRTFTFAQDLEEGYRIFEIVPKDIAKSANEIAPVGDAETIRDDPVIAFPKSDTITYVIAKKIGRPQAERITTLLMRPEGASSSSSLTGFAILGGIGLDTGWGWIAWLCVGLLLVYLAWYLDLPKQLQFIVYRFGRKENVRYLRVLIHDAEDQLGAGDYPKAEMLYKEVRMTYDTLSVPARNDLYEEIISLVKRMDTYYFNTVMIELDACLKGGDHEGAIVAYEKLLGTFERLDTQQQETLVQTIVALGRRLGLEATA